MSNVDTPNLKSEPLDRVVAPFQRFANTQTSGGIVLLLCAVVAIVWANSPWGETYEALWSTEIVVGFREYSLTRSLHFWINDGLMAVFFFVVGLEIKREVLVGELSSPRQAALPVIAAFGGMVAPAAIFAALNYGTDGIRGWGVPVATDIAFALGVLALVGDRIPVGVRVLLAAVAIADDIGATLVIAVFYTEDLFLYALVVGLGVFVLMALLNHAGVRNPLVYLLLGIALWMAFLKSGVHPTMAGVLGALAIPTRTRMDSDEFVRVGRLYVEEFASSGEIGLSTFTNTRQRSIVQALEHVCEQAQTPLQRLERLLHPWVSFVIMPVFALANSGVILDRTVIDHMLDPVAIGIVLGLVFGKHIGIFGASWLAVHLRLADLPHGLRWAHIYGVGWLGGIGFTMALFIAGLAFQGTYNHAVSKAGIMLGSLIAGTIGYLFLRRLVRRDAAAEAAR